jgi:Rps23 Pro-64 3,4-dihydroxylase Tpa1-like proline 4-hydroxylase
MPAPTYKVADLGAIHILRDGQVTLELPSGPQTLPMDRFQFLLQFATASSLADVADLVEGAQAERLGPIVDDLERRRLLRRIDGAGIDGDGASIATRLAPRYRTPEALQAIGHHLQAGRCVVLEDAFEADFAEHVYGALRSYDAWRVDQDYATSSFSYHHHKLLDSAVLPEALQTCAKLFGSAATKSLVSNLSNRDCSGDLAFGASLYLPGDYALPHTDAIDVRNVTLNWYLTRDWSPLWGGHLHWCPSWERLVPGYNTLALFVVSRESRHFVSNVLPTAQGRRYTVNTWWLAPSEQAARRPLREQAPLAGAPPAPIPGLSVLG